MDIALLRESYATFIAIIATINGKALNATSPTPAARILSRFGADRIASWTKRHRSRVHAWAWPTSKGGTGGVIPPRSRSAIIEGAKRDLNEDLAFADFEPQAGETYLMDDA